MHTMHMRTTTDNFTLSHLFILEFCSISVSPLRKIPGSKHLDSLLKFRMCYGKLNNDTNDHENVFMSTIDHHNSYILPCQVIAITIVTLIVLTKFNNAVFELSNPLHQCDNKL